MASRTRDDRPPTKYTPTLNTDSEHEEYLLGLFAMHRVATAYMVMDLFPNRFRWHNQTMRHLNRLANQGYLSRHNHNDGYVFIITDVGYDRCRDFLSIDLETIPRRYQTPTGRQADHELLITGTAIALYKYIFAEDSQVQFLKDGRFMLREIEVEDPETGEIARPFDHIVPDYWYMVRNPNGTMMIRYVEVIAGEASPTRIRQKFHEYQKWGQQPHVQAYLNSMYTKWGALEPRPEFEVHCILESRSWKHTDAWKERMTMQQTFQVEPKMQGRVWTTTKEALEAALSEGLSINHDIWHRGQDLLGVREDWKRARPGKRTDMVEKLMRRIPTYSLFA